MASAAGACACNEFDFEVAAFHLVGWLPKAACHLEHRVRDQHRKRRTLLLVPVPNPLLPNFMRSVENLHQQVEAFILDLVTERHSPWALNQTELKVNVLASGEDSPAVAPDEAKKPLLSLQVPGNEVVSGSIGVEQRCEPLVECNVNATVLERQRGCERGLSGPDGTLDQMDFRHRWSKGHAKVNVVVTRQTSTEVQGLARFGFILPELRGLRSGQRRIHGL